MISVVIETHDDEQALARTLASLVVGAVEGVVREVIVCDRGSSDGTAIVAEHAGCVLLAGVEPAQAAESARGDWLLFIRPGARLVSGWVEPVREHMAMSTEPATFSRSPQTRSTLLARLFAKKDPLAEGLLVPKGSPQSKRRLRLHAELHAA